jgi:DNA-binding PadR family transcriptional regulator
MTNAELAVLSLVTEKPRHGYEIEQVIEERGMRDWTELGFSSIYYLLKKLEGTGLVESQLQETERGPARKVFRATTAGRKALREGVIEALSVPEPRYPPLQLGLANLPGVPLPEAIAALRQYHASLSERENYVKSRQRDQLPLPYFVDAMFQHSLALIRAEIDWLNSFIEELEVRNVQD